MYSASLSASLRRPRFEAELLAGAVEAMAKFRPYSRRVLRTRIRTWRRRYAKVVAVCSAAVVLLIEIEAGLLLGLHRPGPTQWFLFGAISTFLVAALVGAFGAMFLITDEEAVRQIRGAWAEGKYS